MDDNRARISPRQRARWAIRHTGWVSPAYDVLPAAAAAAATFVVTLVTAPKGTPVDEWSIGAPLVAGVVALLGTYLLVNLIEFAVRYAKAGPRLRIEEDRRRQDSLIANADDLTITDWLGQQLVRPEFHVRLAAVFGSVTQAYPTRDVDVVVQLQPGSDRRVRTAGLRLKELGRNFEAEFHLLLHLQLFASTETDALERFTTRAGSLKVVIGADYWAEVSAPSTSPSSEVE
jgi:hypothetical protein